MAKLIRWFSEVVKAPTEALRERTEQWAATVMVARSLGRCVSLELVVRDFWLRRGVKGEIAPYGLERGLLLFRFEVTEERDLVLQRPWTAAGQALALELWRLGFFPVEGAITTALLWVRLPWLPVEFWDEEALQEVLRLVGELVSMDECTAKMRRLEFAKVCIRIDLGHPLLLGVLVEGPSGLFWQHFVYESVEGVYLQCGLFHPLEECCR
ncbi:uncharacterized protein [Elaeis guineensis]|uniref:Uncharacterized protein LOC105056733 n=1 Tax=Elaeis guineensis var. tenera TaxID=51953 RepID=A0A6I9S5D3_ELAGV|nr:uncharacterized protein LOC105056733 [Elaeis guineensis]